MSKQNHQFQIILPKEWEDVTIHYFKGPEESGLPHGLTMIVDHYPPTLDLAEYAEDHIEALKQSYPNGETLKNEAKDLANGGQAHEVVFKWAQSEKMVLFQKMVFIESEKAVVSFKGNFTKKTLKTIGLHANQIIESFVPTTSS